MTDIRDRIVELRRVRASDLLANPANWRRHPDEQRSALAGVLAEIGFADAAIGRDIDGAVMLLDGHLRKDLAGDTEIPVLIVDLDDREADILLATLDPLAAMAVTDDAALSDLISSIDASDAVSELLAGIAGADETLKLPEPEIPEPPKKAKTKPGQFIMLGRHTLHCGDSLEDASYRINADLMFADPPYTVGIDYGAATDDKRSRAEYREWLTKWWEVAWPHVDRAIVTSGWHQQAWLAELVDAKFSAPWVKSNSTTRGVVSDFALYEPLIFVGTRWKSGEKKRATDVFEYPMQHPHVKGHPVPKPLNLIIDLLTHYTKPDHTVIDPFGGSGTTLLAAEATGRTCYMIEKHPPYCDVIISRFREMSPDSDIKIV